MTASSRTRPWAGWAGVFVAALAVTTMAPVVVQAEQVKTIRMRPVANSFVTPKGKVIRRIVNTYMTATPEGVKILCGNLEQVRSILLVTSFNYHLTGDWPRDLRDLTRALFKGLMPMVGRDKLSAVHLVLGVEEGDVSKVESQKRREQVADCTHVKSLPQDAVTVNFADTQAPSEAAAPSAPAQQAVRPGPAERLAEAPAAGAPAEPFVTHPQMVDKDKPLNMEGVRITWGSQPDPGNADPTPVTSLAQEVSQRIHSDENGAKDAPPEAPPAESEGSSVWRNVAAALSIIAVLCGAVVLGLFAVKARQDRRKKGDRRGKDRRDRDDRRTNEDGDAAEERRSGKDRRDDDRRGDQTRRSGRDRRRESGDDRN